jgi:hypothetical protein
MHTRLCGKQVLGRLFTQSKYGTSPRVRVTVRPVVLRIIENRCIPAYAGNRPNRLKWPWLRAVHPGLRGKQVGGVRILDLHGGASPPTQETVLSLAFRRLPRRCIPAYAGNRSRRPLRTVRRPVHPRIRGKQLLHRALGDVAAGASPPTWETGAEGRAHHLGQRCTPTNVGNRTASSAPASTQLAHLRLRGQQIREPDWESRVFGTSPHTRETGFLSGLGEEAERYIPAGAGNSDDLGTPRSAGLVHPRMCGKQSTRRMEVSVNIGSFPRVREQASTSSKIVLKYGASPRERVTAG